MALTAPSALITITAAWALLVMLLLALRLSSATLQRLTFFLAGLTGVQMIAVATIAFLPMETWKKHRLYDGIVLTVKRSGLISPSSSHAIGADTGAPGFGRIE